MHLPNASQISHSITTSLGERGKLCNIRDVQSRNITVNVFFFFKIVFEHVCVFARSWCLYKVRLLFFKVCNFAEMVKKLYLYVCMCLDV